MPTYAAPEPQVGSQTLTVGAAAVGLTVPAAANHAQVQVLAAPIRCRADTSTPTAASGKQVAAGETIRLWGVELKNFAAIRETGTDATLEVDFYKATYEPLAGG